MIKRLDELEPGDGGVVVNLVGSGPLLRRLVDMGLVIGTRVKVLRRSPLGDPVEFEVRGYNLSLRKEEARHVFVKVE
ncbi:MAG: ferrous iron transport protein A [Thaumarchaeota archaeon]|nr:ferrous iron transport protein A [Nitrososphaerota archaeon]